MSKDINVMDSWNPYGIWHALSLSGFIAWVSAMIGWLQPFLGAAGILIGIVYYTMSVYEMETVQTWLKNRKARKLAHEVMGLEAEQTRIIGRLKQLGVLESAGTTVADGTTTTTTVATHTPPAI